jgi:hypothetical protein
MTDDRAGQRWLHTVWESEAAFNGVATSFEAENALPASGAKHATTGADPPRWRIDWAKIVLALLALVPPAYTWVSAQMAAPDVRPTTVRSSKDVLVGTPFELEVEVTNCQARGDVHVDRSRLDPHPCERVQIGQHGRTTAGIPRRRRRVGDRSGSRRVTVPQT